ncbi:MAG: hypothetical protein VKL39_00435 [Leptolyngbyaceae bacterium]|nr:hypothetical protein [Leptolyngbyaceae bacterium]
MSRMHLATRTIQPHPTSAVQICKLKNQRPQLRQYVSFLHSQMTQFHSELGTIENPDDQAAQEKALSRQL